jgi:hypothetical protein
LAEQPFPPYPKNAPGDFYVEHNCCITCEAPYNEAPDLMAHDDEGDYPHCYFKRQPETPEEVERAVMAYHVSCVQAVRYAGRNPKIIRRFRELGSGNSCDVLSPEEAKALPLTLRQKLEEMRRAGGPGSAFVIIFSFDAPGDRGQPLLLFSPSTL